MDGGSCDLHVAVGILSRKETELSNCILPIFYHTVNVPAACPCFSTCSKEPFGVRIYSTFNGDRSTLPFFDLLTNLLL